MYRAMALRRIVAGSITLLASGVFPAIAADLSQAAQLIVNRTNVFREEQGLKPQVVDAKLQEAAQEFARFMARTREYGHTADGRTPAQRASAQGYAYCIVSENIGYVYHSRGYDTVALAQQFVNGWKESPEHRKSMLDPDTTQTGVAIAQGREEGGHYFGVQMFGLPKSAAIRFSVRNQASGDIAYSAGGRSFTLAPRAARTHTVCRTLELKIARSGKDAPFIARPKDGVRYDVTGTPDGLAVREGPAPNR